MSDIFSVEIHQGFLFNQSLLKYEILLLNFQRPVTYQGLENADLSVISDDGQSKFTDANEIIVG